MFNESLRTNAHEYPEIFWTGYIGMIPNGLFAFSRKQFGTENIFKKSLIFYMLNSIWSCYF